MKSWVLKQPNELVFEENQPSVLAEDHVKVKIEEVLLTRSDYKIYCGESKREYPFVFGRNAVGVVSEVYNKDKSMLQKMDRVAIEPYIPCLSCEECGNGDFDKCSSMTELGQNANGLLQNFVDLPFAQLHRLPDNLSTEKALFVSYTAFCLNVVDALNLEKGRHVAIFSSTKTGLILAQLVAYYQAVPIFISNKEILLETAREQGIFYCFNPSECDLEKEIVLVTGGRMCSEIAFFADCDFRMSDMYTVAGVNANVCLVGYSNKDSKLSVAQICQKHLNIFCVYNGAGNYSSAINLLVTNKLDVDKLLGKKIKFENLAVEIEKITAEDLVLQSHVIKID